MVDIKKPAYSLEKIKSAFRTIDDLNMTYSAMQGQYELGFRDEDVVEVIQSLTLDDFYKSMLPYHGSFAEWQDVYKPVFNDIELYLKFQVNKKGEMIISFKKR